MSAKSRVLDGFLVLFAAGTLLLAYSWVERSKVSTAALPAEAAISHPPPHLELHHVGNKLEIQATQALSQTCASNRLLRLVVAFSPTGCNLCLEELLPLLSDAHTSETAGDLAISVLAFGKKQEVNGQTRGYMAENPDLCFQFTTAPIPKAWQELAKPHFLLVSEVDHRILMDLRLDVSNPAALNYAKAYVRALTQSTAKGEPIGN